MSLKKQFQLPCFFPKSPRKYIVFLYFLYITCKVARASNQKEEYCYWVDTVEIVTNGQPITVREQKIIKKIARLQGGDLMFKPNQTIKNATERLKKRGYKTNIEVIKQQLQIKLQIKLLDTYPNLSPVQFKGVTEEEKEKLINKITQEISTLLTTEEKEKLINKISQEIGISLTTEEKEKLINKITQEIDTPLTTEEKEKLINKITQKIGTPLTTEEKEKLINKVSQKKYPPPITEEKEKLISQISQEKYTLLTPYITEKVIQVIANHFLEKGFADIKVLKNKNNTSFEIIKKNKVYVKKITFKGNKHFTSQELIKLLIDTEKSINPKSLMTLIGNKLPYSLWDLSPIIAGGYVWYFFRPKGFVKKTLDQEARNLRRHYRNKGFLDIDISYKLHRHTKEKDKLKISFEVKEGKRYKIGSIVWEGNKLFKASELNEALGIKEGDIYNPTCLELTQESNIYRLYAKKERFVILERLMRFDNDKVNLVLKIHERPAPTINKIIIDTNIDPLTVRVMLKKSGLEEGVKMTKEKLQASYYYMATSGLFNPEKIKLIPKKLDATTTNLECYFKSVSKLINIGGKVELPKAYIGLSVSHFDLKKLFKRKKMPGKEKISATFNTDDSFHSGFFTLSYKNDWLLLGEDLYTFGFNIGGKPSMYLGKKWNKEHYRYLAQLEAKLEKTKKLTIALNYKMDSTNNLLYPTKGDVIEIEPMLDIKDKGIKIVGRYSYFKTQSFSPSLRPFTIKNSCSMGMHVIGKPLEGFSFGQKWFFEEFSTNFVPLRGYDFSNKLTPNRKVGNLYFKESFELRYPIGDPTKSYVLGFMDCGLVSSSLTNYKTGGSLGIGYRYSIGNFTIGIDYAITPREKSFNKIHFFVSQE